MKVGHEYKGKKGMDIQSFNREKYRATSWRKFMKKSFFAAEMLQHTRYQNLNTHAAKSQQFMKFTSG